MARNTTTPFRLDCIDTFPRRVLGRRSCRRLQVGTRRRSGLGECLHSSKPASPVLRRAWTPVGSFSWWSGWLVVCCQKHVEEGGSSDSPLLPSSACDFCFQGADVFASPSLLVRGL